MKDVPLAGSDEKSLREFLTAALANDKEELLFNFIEAKVKVDDIGRNRCRSIYLKIIDINI